MGGAQDAFRYPCHVVRIIVPTTFDFMRVLGIFNHSHYMLATE